MSSLKRRLARLEGSDMLIVPQRDGPPLRFPREAYKEAFLNCMDRLVGGPDIPPPHPLVLACRNSSDPAWRFSYFHDIDLVDGEDTIEPIEDLSEGSATEGGGVDA